MTSIYFAGLQIIFLPEILQNLFTAFDIENYNTNELINLRYKNLMQKNNNIQTTDLSLVQQSNNSLLNSMMPSVGNKSTNIDSNRLLNILTEEFLSTNDNLKLENYIGDLSSFDAEVLVTCDKIEEIL